MTPETYSKLRMLRSTMQGRADGLEASIIMADSLARELQTPEYKQLWQTRHDTLVNWQHYNNRLLAQIETIIQEVEDDKEQDSLPF